MRTEDVAVTVAAARRGAALLALLLRRTAPARRSSLRARLLGTTALRGGA